jgi:hypothetical protein
MGGVPHVPRRCSGLKSRFTGRYTGFVDVANRGPIVGRHRVDTHAKKRNDQITRRWRNRAAVRCARTQRQTVFVSTLPRRLDLRQCLGSLRFARRMTIVVRSNVRRTPGLGARVRLGRMRGEDRAIARTSALRASPPRREIRIRGTERTLATLDERMCEVHTTGVHFGAYSRVQ